MKEIGEGEKGKEVGPATVMHESIEIVRAMLGGEEVEIRRQSVSSLRARSQKRCARRSLAYADLHRRHRTRAATNLADAIADGLLTASITTPAFVRYSRDKMLEGAKAAGRDASNLDLGSVIVGSVGEDPKTAREGAREMAAMYLANKVQNIRGSADMLLRSARN